MMIFENFGTEALYLMRADTLDGIKGAQIVDIEHVDSVTFYIIEAS